MSDFYLISSSIKVKISSCNSFNGHLFHNSKLWMALANKEDLIVENDAQVDPAMEAIMALVFNDEHTKELNRKVEAAMLEDWDMRDGVMTSRGKPLPIKANIDLWSYRAKTEFGKGNYTGAMILYQRCIEYNPCDGRPWLGMARLYSKKGQIDLAEKCYKDGLYYNPKNPYLLQSWAVMLEKTGKVKESIKLLTVSVKDNPKHAASWVALAKLHQKFGKIEEARFCYTSAVEGDPRSYVALQAWGVLESELGQISQSRSLFQRAVAIAPRSAHAYQAWATLERREGNLEKAEELVRKALDVFSDSTRIRLSLAEIYELRGEFREARNVFEEGKLLAEKSGDAGFFQSWALFEHRRVIEKETETTLSETVKLSHQDLIRRLFKKAIMVNKMHSASWVAWAKYEEKNGNPDVSRRLLIAGISNFPNSKNIGWFHCCLAHLARQQNDMNTARSCYSRALDATPPHKSLRVLLEFARMETYHGDPRAAIKLHELALKRFPNDERVWNSYVELEEKRPGGDKTSLLARRDTAQQRFQTAKSAALPLDDSSVFDKEFWTDDKDTIDNDSFIM
eukprot:gene3471-6904_t